LPDSLLRGVEDLLESLFKLVDVIVDQLFLCELTLFDNRDQGQTLFNFSHIDHDISISAVRMLQLDDTSGLFVKFKSSTLFVHAVDARDIDQNIDELRADFIKIQLIQLLVFSDVDLGNNIKKESIFNSTGVDKVIHQIRNVAHLRQELLHYLADSFVDGVVIDGGEEVLHVDGDLEFGGEVPLVDDLLYVLHHLDLLLISPVEISVNFVDEDVDIDFRVDLEDLFDGLSSFVALVIDALVASDHVDDRTCVLESLNVLLSLGREVVVSREVDHVKFYSGVVVDL
jgi:hypothetical protein